MADRADLVVKNGRIVSSPASMSSNTCGNRGCNTVLSTDGTQDAILWAYEKSSSGGAILHAYSATDLSNELWNSNMNSSRDQMQTGIGFATPVVVDRRVITAYDQSVVIYAPLN